MLTRLRTTLHNAPSVREMLPDVTSGLISGIVSVTFAAAMAGLVFSGSLSAFMPAGVQLMLFSAAIIALAGALTSSLPASIFCLQDYAAVIVGLISVGIVSKLPPGAPPADGYLAAIATLAAAALVTGSLFFLLGWFRLGSLVRFIPYPVVGGFLAGAGLLLAFGAIAFMIDQPVSLTDLPPLWQPALLVHWLPGAIYGVFLLIVSRRTSHPLSMPALLLAGIGSFYLVLWASGTSIARAAAAGWLPPVLETQAAQAWQPWGLAQISVAPWDLVFNQLGSLLGLAIVSAIHMLLNTSGMEMVAGKDVDLNHELKAAGLANLLSGLAGGAVGYLALSDSTLIYRMGGRRRLVGLIVGAMCALALVAGSGLVVYLPVPVLGGLLFLLGLDFLVTWVYEAAFRLHRVEYAIILAILLVMNIFGFLQGVVLGLALACAWFIVQYSRSSPVRHALSGAEYHSRVERPLLWERLLKKKGDWLFILELQGFVFFGTANALLEQVRRRFADSGLPPVRYLVLDFRLVSGLDSSAVASFVKMKHLAISKQARLVFTGLSPALEQALQADVLTEADRDAWSSFPDLEHGLEWCESQAIETFRSVGLNARPRTLVQELRRSIDDPAVYERLQTYLEKREFPASEQLARQGECLDGLYFIEQGQVCLQRQRPGGEPLRLRTLDAGAAFGQEALQDGLELDADLVAVQPVTLYYLSQEKLYTMQQADPAAAAALFRFLANQLGKRLTDLNDTVEALLR